VANTSVAAPAMLLVTDAHESIASYPLPDCCDPPSTQPADQGPAVRTNKSRHGEPRPSTPTRCPTSGRVHPLTLFESAENRLGSVDDSLAALADAADGLRPPARPTRDVREAVCGRVDSKAGGDIELVGTLDVASGQLHFSRPATELTSRAWPNRPDTCDAAARRTPWHRADHGAGYAPRARLCSDMCIQGPGGARKGRVCAWSESRT
jgi:hypothetical protein